MVICPTCGKESGLSNAEARKNQQDVDDRYYIIMEKRANLERFFARTKRDVDIKLDKQSNIQMLMRKMDEEGLLTPEAEEKMAEKQLKAHKEAVDSLQDLSNKIGEIVGDRDYLREHHVDDLNLMEVNKAINEANDRLKSMVKDFSDSSVKEAHIIYY